MFEPPLEESLPKSTKRKATGCADTKRPGVRRKGSFDVLSDESDGGGMVSPVTHGEGEQDKWSVQRQTRSMNPIPRAHTGKTYDIIDDVRLRTAKMFQPTALQQQIHEAIGHRDHKGKPPQSPTVYT
ncbi:hypothetical protein PC128_g22790 [Phytophthora cactorum]|nr:hypothetical protein PC120_g19998 [Phytophthora cactorum]KAG3152385.1 hypothetical protein PC128_g22790 [Phytophthora cactorum]KAG4045272.1 hypothetical protein PC123_g19312 [Phytophthora cactorum]